jgi:hypothetical protein
MNVTIKIMPDELVERIAAVGFPTIFSIQRLLKMSQSYLIPIVTLHFSIFGIVMVLWPACSVIRTLISLK